MSGSDFSGSVVEQADLAWLETLGYSVLHGPDIIAGELGAERADPHYRNVVPKTLISGELRVRGLKKIIPSDD